MKGQELKASPVSGPPSDDGDCDDTAAMTQTTVGQNPSTTNSGVVVFQQGNLIVGLTALAGVSATSMGAMIVVLLPFPALLALIMFLLSMSGMAYVLYVLAIRQMQALIQGHGIGDYIPRSIYNQLTQTTLHEWMSSTEWSAEYRHLMLYFIPGITPEQLENYVDSLAPRRRDNLRRHGLGHFFGESFMRILMGEARYRAHLVSNQRRPTELILPPPSSSIMADAASDLGSISPESYSPTDLPRSLRMEPAILEGEEHVSRAVEIQNDLAEFVDDELNILSDAVMSMVNTYVSISANTISSTFVRLVDQITPYVAGLGFGLTSISAGFGLFGVWRVTNYPDRPTHPNFPSSQLLWTTGFLGSATAGGMYLFRSGARMMLRQARKQKEEKKKQV